MKVEESKQPEEKKAQDNQKSKIDEPKKIDVYQHLRRNILDPKINCQETLSDEIYYCITCKASTCEQCSLVKHQGHNIVPKTFFYSYTENFFDEVLDVLKDSYKINDDKNSYIELVEAQAVELHQKIDEIKNKKIQEINDLFVKVNKCIKELEDSTNEVKTTMSNFYKKNNIFFNVYKNNDFDNSVFILYYELNYLGFIKNKEMIKRVEKLKNDFVKYKESFETHKKHTIQTMQDFLGLAEPQTNLDDIYWDVKFRLKTYNEHIEKLKQNIYDIMKHSGNMNDLKEVVSILDSKNKKGIQYIFNQDYFTKNQRKRSNNRSTSTNKEMSSPNYNLKNNKTIEAKRGNKNLKQFSANKKLMLSGKKTPFSKSERNYNLFSSTNHSKKTFSSNNNLQKSGLMNFSGKSNSFLSFQGLEHNKNILSNIGIHSYKDITLDDKVKKKYFTYSYIDLYNRLFSQQPRKSFDSNARIFVDYNNRNNLLKEYVKPIVGTNEIMVYDSIQDKSIRVKVNLSKEKHGYEKFPSGCRHLYIEGKLYICGGVDPVSCPINTALVYQPSNNTITRIDNMINNINIYFDEFTSELYALFGALGDYSEKKNIYSEAIEMLELNDISSGWCKIDYYKGSSFDIRQENLITLPFTLTKLLIYGGKSSRENENLFGIYLIDKMELVKADKDLLEKIKCEQKKIKMINNSYGKLNK